MQLALRSLLGAAALLAAIVSADARALFDGSGAFRALFPGRPASAAWHGGAVLAADLAGERFALAGGTVAQVAILSGTLRPHVEEWTGIRFGARADGPNANLLTADYASAVVGTVGSGGALPTGWSTAIANLTAQVTARTSTDVTVRISGTPNTTGQFYVNLGGPTATVVSPSTRYNFSYFARFGSDPVGAQQFRAAAQDYVAGGSPLSSGTQATVASVQTDVPFPHTYTYQTNGSAARAAPRLAFVGINGTPVDFTVTLSRVQITQSEGRLPYGLATGAVAADTLALASPDALLAGDFAALAVGRGPVEVGTGTLAQIGTTTDGIEVKLAGYLVQVVSSAAGTSTTTTIGRALPWQRVRVALSVSGRAVRASLNGKPAVGCGVAGATLSGMTLGRGATGPLNSAIEQAALWPSGKGDTDLAALSKVAGIYDDFDRPDGALGSPWSGTGPYMVTGTSAGTAISGKRALTQPSGLSTTSQYITLDLGAPPTFFASASAFENGTAAAVIGMIPSPNLSYPSSQVAGITQKSVHFLWSFNALFFQVFDAGNVSSNGKDQYPYGTNAPKDGSTVNTTAYVLSPIDGAIIARMFDGTLTRAAHRDFRLYTGRYVTAEPYWDQASPARPLIAALQVE